MNVAGFEEALSEAIRVEFEPGLIIFVPSIPGLVILKLIAWTERHRQNNKDADDLYRIIPTFDLAGNQDHIF